MAWLSKKVAALEPPPRIKSKCTPRNAVLVHIPSHPFSNRHAFPTPRVLPTEIRVTIFSVLYNLNSRQRNGAQSSDRMYDVNVCREEPKSILPDGLQIQIRSSLASTNTPSLLAVVATSSKAEAEAGSRSCAWNVQAASTSGFAITCILDSFGRLHLGSTIRLDSFPFQVRGIFDCLERRHAGRTRASRGGGRGYA